MSKPPIKAAVLRGNGYATKRYAVSKVNTSIMPSRYYIRYENFCPSSVGLKKPVLSRQFESYNTLDVRSEKKIKKVKTRSGTNTSDKQRE